MVPSDEIGNQSSSKHKSRYIFEGMADMLGMLGMVEKMVCGDIARKRDHDL